VAHLVRARGIKGELVAIPLNDRRSRFDELHRVIVKDAEYEVERVWWHQEKLILKFRGVDTMSDAELLTGCEVRVPRSRRVQLEPGEFFESDLIGCEVVERDGGASLGRVVRLADGGSAGLLELENGLLIPFAREICVAIQPEARRIVVDLPEGLKELNQA